MPIAAKDMPLDAESAVGGRSRAAAALSGESRLLMPAMRAVAPKR